MDRVNVPLLMVQGHFMVYGKMVIQSIGVLIKCAVGKILVIIMRFLVIKTARGEHEQS